MCYPCTQCGACGKFNKTSPLYRPTPEVPCFKCGGKLDLETGICISCGEVAFVPSGVKKQQHAIVHYVQ